MGWWLVGADTLARSRFVVSPLAETVARLMDLEAGTAAYPGERLWHDTHLTAYRARLAADPVAAAVVRAGFGAYWTADFLTPAPAGETPLFEEELARLRATPAETAHADLAVSLGGPLPAGLRRADVVERAAGLLEWVWAEAVRPYWPRWRRIVEADVVARTERLSRGGWAAVLEGMGPGTRWLGEGRLRINSRPYPPRELHGADLLFVPVIPRRGWVTWDEPHRYAVVYPCDGVLAGTEPRPASGPLGALLGAARAEVLLLLGSPRSTTHLVALTGQGLGSVGRHLKVLHEAGLIRRRRAGRSVLYQRTEAGESLVRAGGGT
ncbi:ArsR/SmtB family transcription factor [Streptomyces albidoflavus]